MFFGNFLFPYFHHVAQYEFSYWAFFLTFIRTTPILYTMMNPVQIGNSLFFYILLYKKPPRIRV